MSAEIKKKYVRIGQIVVMMSVTLGSMLLRYWQIFVTSTIV